MADEFASWIHDEEDIKSMGRFPHIPLRVIARDKITSIRNWMRYDIPEEEAVRHENKWRELQEELALLSNQGELIISIYLLEEYWGKGLATKLMDEIINILKGEGCRSISLWVYEANIRARKFYEKHGFIFDGTKKESHFSNKPMELRYILEI